MCLTQDTSSSSKTGLNKLNRAAEREAKAELRRQEVQRKRRQREEQLRREKEEAERMEQMVRDLEEERLRKEEARRYIINIICLLGHLTSNF